MLSRKRREMRKWAQSNTRNKKSLRPIYENKTPKDNFRNLVIKKNCSSNNQNIYNSKPYNCGIPIQNYNRKNLTCYDKNNDLKVSKCELKKTNFQINDSIIKRIDNKNGIHNPCYHHNCQKYLIDRINIRQGEKQLYGTQLEFNKEKKRFVLPNDIYDIQNLDKRRSDITLEPIADYIAKSNENKVLGAN